jgi:hypothetical protein
MCSEVESIQSRWVHLEAAGLQPDSRWTPGGLQTHYRLTFGGIAIKEKMLKNGGWTPGVHLDSAGVQVESNRNMWRSVKSSLNC